MIPTFIFLIWVVFTFFYAAPLLVFYAFQSNPLYKREQELNRYLSFLFGPILASLLLYYLLLASTINFTGLLIFMGSICIAGLGCVFLHQFELLKNNGKALLLIFTVLAISFPIAYYTKAMGHDFAEYCLFSSTLASHQEINFSNYWYNANNDFYFVGLHGFAFPLLSYPESLFAETRNIPCYYFTLRFTHLYYSYMLLYSGFFFFRNRKKEMLVIYALVCFTSLHFIYIFTNYHLDTTRISAILGCLIVFFYILDEKVHQNYIFIFGFVAGLAAFIHSMNAIALGICLLVILQKFKFNIRISSYSTALYVAGGFIHYLLDMTIGRGWILENIKFF